MKIYLPVADEITKAINELEAWLTILPTQVITEKRNRQNRSIRMILGHMVDSASNNTHRVIHLQYQNSPINFPDYANLGNNDRWIAIQNYQQEDWKQLIQLWKYTHLHFCHVIKQVNPEMINQVWVSALGEKISLDMMIKDFPNHFKLHIAEIKELAIG